MNIPFKNISPLLSTGKNKFSKWMSYFGLGIGMVMLLVAVQLFVNINQLLQENNTRKNGYDFISVTKLITNDNMGKNNTFSPEEFTELKNQPTIEAVSPLISNQYRVKASAGDLIPFSTDLFLESIDKDFIDTVPPSFKWVQGQREIPIIFSSDFLEIYNVFAPAEDLPQLSDKTISSLNISLECYGPKGVQRFTGNIVALSDRINSIIVPKSFMDWSNQNFAGVTIVNPSRIYLKTKDANNIKLLAYLKAKDYRINKDKTKFGRLKNILQNIVSCLSLFSILVIVLALLLFSFYLQLMIANAKENLRLLITLGYSPKWLIKTVTKTWIPVYVFILIAAVIFTSIFQYAFVKMSFMQSTNLSIFLHWSVILVAVLLFILSVFTNYRLIKKEVYRIV